VELGNLDSLRDWGYAPEYTEMMWRILQKDEPGDYVCATNEMHTVREFCEHTFTAVDMPLTFEGEGVNEVGRDKDGIARVKVNPDYFRPAEVELLIGNPAKAKAELGWKPNVTFKELVTIMAAANWNKRREKNCRHLIHVSNEIPAKESQKI
jgi:GDPmannose 4,6-dehydratase